MMYSVKALADASGVSIRTLHYYDEIDLLKPAYINEAGYRYYEEKQLLLLQQILFFRELGFELKQIKALLNKDNFDQKQALHMHKILLQEKIERFKNLIHTIDETITTLERKQPVNTNIFKGFAIESEEQKKYEQYLDEYFKKQGKDTVTEYTQHMQESKENIRGWSEQKWKDMGNEFDMICTALVNCMHKNIHPDAPEVQAIIRKHYAWLSTFWKPNKESYAGHAQFIKDSELKDAYAKYDEKLADFIAEAIVIFANKEL